MHRHTGQLLLSFWESFKIMFVYSTLGMKLPEQDNWVGTGRLGTGGLWYQIIVEYSEITAIFNREEKTMVVRHT